jgi:hypothetical protein
MQKLAWHATHVNQMGVPEHLGFSRFSAAETAFDP